MSQVQKPPSDTTETEVISQQRGKFREGWPEWIRQMPQLRFPNEPKEGFSLIQRKKLETSLSDKVDADTIQRINEDIDFLEYELERLFKERDHVAKYQQNRYRQYQLSFMVLATAATIVGAFQAIALNSLPTWLPMFAFIETIIALATTYIATISSSEAPLPLWMMNRRRAEYLRREFYRYMMDLSPYDELSGYQRQQRLSIRAANINRGVYPDKSAD